MSAGNKIVNVRFEDALHERMQEELTRRNEVTSEAVWSMSDYIRRAVQEKIAHADRGRKKTGERRYECRDCGHRFDINKIAYVVKPLFSKKEYVCVFCQRVTIAPRS